jgi:hypothetical protein
MAWTSWHPVMVWSLAWGVTGASLKIADVFSTPRHGPFWIAVVGGLLAWSVAGAATVSVLHRNPSPTHTRIAGMIWGGAYLLVLGLGTPLLASAGFVGALIAWSVGAATAAYATTWLIRESPGLVWPIVMALEWGLGFFVAGYLAIVLAMIMGQGAKGLFRDLLGQYAAFIVGWGVGCALAGLLAGTFGLLVARAVSRSAASKRMEATPL